MNRRYTDPAIAAVFGWPEVQERWWRITLAWMNHDQVSEYVPESTASGHEVDDFLNAVEPLLPRECRHLLHLGLTSSDLTETALAMTLRQADNRILGLVSLLRLALQTNSFAHHHGVAYTHGVPATAMDHRHRADVWSGQLARLYDVAPAVPYGRFRGPTGGYSRWATPENEARTLARLGLQPYPHPITQVLPRHVWLDHLALPLALVDVCADIATDLRLLLTIGDAEIRGGTTSSAMAHKSNPSRLERVVAARTQVHALVGAVRDAGPLWLERDLSHSLVDRCSIESVYHLTALAVSDTKWALDHVAVSREPAAPTSYESVCEWQSAGTARSEARRQYATLP